MADTGLPWELPYPLPTDLVRDGADAIKDLAEATATGLSAAGSEGIGPNVVQTVKTDVSTFSVGVGGISGDVTGLTATITPSSSTSRVLVFVGLTGSAANINYQATLFRDGSSTGFVGDADGSRRRVSSGAFATGGGRSPFTLNMMYLDSPNTTDPVVYSVRVGHDSSSTSNVHVNRGDDDSNSNRNARSASSITLIEVAA